MLIDIALYCIHLHLCGVKHKVSFLDTIIAPSTVQSRNFQSVTLQSVGFQSASC